MKEKITRRGYTFDDVLLLPRYSEIIPSQVDLSTRLTKKIALKTPLLSAAMDTVTESEMGIALAKEGGIGILHKNLSIEEQTKEVRKVKEVDLTAEEKEKASLDKYGKLLCGAGIGITEDLLDRAEALLNSGANVLVLDSAHGHSRNVLQALEKIKSSFPSAEVIVGNVATYLGARDLMEKGADAVKVGMGPGSICTTRMVTGCGVPQMTAIANAVEALRGSDIKVIADGGIRYSGDIAKALAAGAHCVMVGSMFAGTEEAPGEIEIYQGRSFKSYRGMGSLAAMAKGSADRYFQTDNAADKLVPEGIEGRVAYKGALRGIIHQQMGGLRSAMGLTGCATIEELRTKAKFVRITGAGIRESHVHDVTITKEAPNYQSH